MDGLKDLVAPKTLHWISYVANVFWIVLGTILSTIVLYTENSEPTDFRCGSTGDEELIGKKCYEQYEKQYNKFGIPVYGFVIINFLVTASVCGIYSQAMKSRVEVLSEHDQNQDQNQNDEEMQTQPRNNNLTEKKLFKAYCLQLLTRFFLGILFVFLQTKLLYPLSFPSNFSCNLTRDGKFSDITASGSRNETQTQTSYECHNQRAAKKTFWADAVIVVTGTFVFLVFIECLYMLLWRAREGSFKAFTEDQEFHKRYLSSNTSNSDSTPSTVNELGPLLNNDDDHTNPSSTCVQPCNESPPEPPHIDNRTELPPSNAPATASRNASHDSSINPNPTDEQTSVSTFIKHMKEHVRWKTERSDGDPFDPNPGEGSQGDQTLDQIYTNLVIHEGRVDMHDLIAGDREKPLEEYPTRKPRENSQPTQPADIFRGEKQKILVVGRPGIGKTMFSTKILRNWASDNLFKEAQKSPVDFKVAFLIKLRRFNSKQDEKLSLRELLSHSEYSAEDLNEEVWNYILQNPNKVLVIFDGFDEYSGKNKIDDESHSYRDNEQESMPIHFLFKKIASGDILRGATVLTTTRPNAGSFMRSFNFDKTVEILGFTTEQVDEYVQKFTKGDYQKANTIKQHISNNRNLLSFCYVPVNCFIICSCLFQLLCKSASPGLLPTTLTKIYSIAVKYFYFRHGHSEKVSSVEDNFLDPFKKLSSSVQGEFTRLGEIAFRGIENGRLIFESVEVNNLKSNGLFHRLPDTSDDPLSRRREQYCFIHLTMQEFMAAKYLIDTLSSEELRNFVSAHVKDGAWYVVMQFVAGLLAEQEGQSTDIFSDLLPLKTLTQEVKIKLSEDSEEQTETLTCWPAHEDKALVVTLFNCMYENNASDREVQKKLAKIGCNALKFSECNLSPLDCLALVHALKSVEGILDFNLSFNNFQSLGCIEIAKLLPGNQHNQGFCELKRLNLGTNYITDEGVKHLATALTHTNCTLNSLDLENNNITDKAVKHLSTALTHTNCKLNSLNLGDNSITDENVKNLSKALTHTNCKLNILNLSGNNVTDEGVKHLSTALTHTNCKLKSLNLWNNKITDQGVNHLSTAVTHTNCKLNSLDLMNNSLTDQGVKHLSTALTNTNCKLNSLNLFGNKITRKGKNLVNSININCEVRI